MGEKQGVSSSRDHAPSAGVKLEHRFDTWEHPALVQLGMDWLWASHPDSVPPWCNELSRVAQTTAAMVLVTLEAA